MSNKWPYIARMSGISLIMIKLIWDLTGDVVFDNNIATVLDIALIVIGACIGGMLYNDLGTTTYQAQVIRAWRDRAVQAESNLLHLGRAVTERLNARLMKPEIDPTE